MHKTYTDWLAANLPSADLANYPPVLFEQFAAHAAMLRAEVPWCAALAEQVFLDYVLCPRVNDEDLRFHSAIFFKELYPRVEGLSVEEAVLETNRWCHEKATYQQQDDRTAAPLTVFLAGSGRCGEESAFAVAALRSVGIPARQVYASRWSHCDDNHAWVEALVEEKWRFFGACEPEPVLDKGWFNAAAARAVLIHTRRFGAAPVDEGLNGERLEQVGPAVYHNQTARYAPVRRLRVSVQKDGAPVAGARVSVEVLNGAQLWPLVTLQTDPGGRAEVTLGRGDLVLIAHCTAGQAEALVPATQDECTLDLAPAYTPVEGWQSWDFAAPPAALGAMPPLTATQKQSREEVLREGRALRENRLAGFWQPRRAEALGEAAEPYLRAARGNFDEIARFLEAGRQPLRFALLESVSDKDLRDATAAVLEDHLAGAAAHEQGLPPDVFRKWVLCPRIATEPLAAWRGPLAGAFTQQQRAAYRQNPGDLWAHLCARPAEQKGAYPNLYWLPHQALAAGRWDEKSRALLFVALLRAWGLPARLRNEDGLPEYWQAGRFAPVVKLPTAPLRLHHRQADSLQYRQSWSLARLEAGRWQTLNIAEPQWQEDGCSLQLPQGFYRLTTAARLPSGNQYAAVCDVALTGLEGAFETLRLREYSVKELLFSVPLPEFTACGPDGQPQTYPGLDAGRPAILMWLAPGEEPTEHVLNELMETAELPEAELVCFLRTAADARHPTMAAALARVPRLRVYTGEWEYTLELLARRLYRDPDSPPLVICCDAAGNAVYASSGYNVGLVEFLAQAVALL